MKKIFLLALGLIWMAAPVWAADVAGTWRITMPGPKGPEIFDIIISGASPLIIQGTHPVLGKLSGTGTLANDAIAMLLSTGDGKGVEFDFTGKVTGNTMAGTRTVEMAGGPPGDGADGPEDHTPPDLPNGPGPGNDPRGGDAQTWTAVRK